MLPKIASKYKINNADSMAIERSVDKMMRYDRKTTHEMSGEE